MFAGHPMEDIFNYAAHHRIRLRQNGIWQHLAFEKLGFLRVTVEHLISRYVPISGVNGNGRNGRWNLAAACSWCNRSRGTSSMDADIWFQCVQDMIKTREHPHWDMITFGFANKLKPIELWNAEALTKLPLPP
jgi:hypothetical protein